MTKQEIEYIKLGLGNCAVMSLDLNNKAQHALNRLAKLEEVCEEIADALQELQQLREERRWRKVSDEVPEKSCWCMYYQDGRFSTGRCVVDDYGVTWLCGNGLLIPALANLFYRPLPMDLPEEE